MITTPHGRPAVRSWYHLVYECPRYTHSRSDRKIWDDHSLDLCEQSELFHAHALPFVLFLQQSRAAFVPESVPEAPFDPG